MSGQRFPSGYDMLRCRSGQLVLIDQYGERIHVRAASARAEPGRFDQRRSAPEEGVHHNDVAQMRSW